MKNWRCGPSLRDIVKVIAAFEITICIIAIIPLTLIMLDVCFEGDFGVFIEFVLGVPRTIQLSIWLVFWTVIVIKFILDVNLYRGANNKNYEKSLIWLTVTFGVLITCYIWSLLSLNMFWTKRGCLIVVVVDVGVGIYKGFEMIVVYKFMQKLKKIEGLKLFTATKTTAPISITDFDFDHRRAHYNSLHARQTSNVTEEERGQDNRIPVIASDEPPSFTKLNEEFWKR